MQQDARFLINAVRIRLQKALQRALRSSRREFDVVALIRAMMFNRLCKPDSKLVNFRKSLGSSTFFERQEQSQNLPRFYA